MDFEWTDEQRTFRDSLIAFAHRELSGTLTERDAGSRFPYEEWKKLAAMGIQGLPIPERFGGQGADALTVVLAMEALGYGCRDNGLLFSLNAQMWSCEMPISKFGTDEQRWRYLPRLCDGSMIGVQAMTEPDSGSDAFSLSTDAVQRGDGFVLNGAKTFITNAPVADVFVVFASTDPAVGFAGLSAFLVERDVPGLTVGPPFHKMGLTTSPMSEVVLDDCEVPANALLGSLGAGMAVFNSSMEWERSCILASAIGTMTRQLERSIDHARQRRQFGKPIGKNQAVAHRLVEMKVRLETARLLIYRTAWLKSHGRPAKLESAMTKLYISESFLSSSLDALQIHGGYGYMQEYEFEREVRDAVAGRIYSGTSEMQRNIIAACMGL